MEVISAQHVEPNDATEEDQVFLRSVSQKQESDALDYLDEG